MSNLNKTLSILREHWPGGDTPELIGQQTRCAEALYDAGLVVPHVPSPNPDGRIWCEERFIVERDDAGIYYCGPLKSGLRPAEARRLAHILLTAVNDIEKERGY